MAWLLCALVVANALAFASLFVPAVAPPVLAVAASPLLVVTATHAPLTVLLLLAFAGWMAGGIVSSDRHLPFANATTFTGALFIDAAVFAYAGHPVIAMECAALAPLLRRIMLSHAVGRT